MAKSWRPEGWDNPYPQEGEETGTYWTELVFEEGADAMLESLKKDGTHQTDIPGTVVFIPDDEE